MPLTIDITLSRDLCDFIQSFQSSRDKPPSDTTVSEQQPPPTDTPTNASILPANTPTNTSILPADTPTNVSIFTAPADSAVNVSLEDKPSWLDLTAIAQQARQEVEGDINHLGLPNQFLFMRHAERVDRCFPSWAELAFATGAYRPYDLNQPLTLPTRVSSAFKHDAPITQMGALTAQLVGRALALADPPTLIYTSPALHCLQTALLIARVLHTSNMKVVPVRIEPGFFHFLSNYDALPHFLTPVEASKQLPEGETFIDMQYRAHMCVMHLWRQNKHETPEQHMHRLAQTMDAVKMASQGKHRVLIIAHASIFEGALRHLTNDLTAVSTFDELNALPAHYPYSAIMSAHRSGKSYQIVESPFPPMSYLEFTSRVDMHFYLRNKLVNFDPENIARKSEDKLVLAS